jgi:hypothetical protein
LRTKKKKIMIVSESLGRGGAVGKEKKVSLAAIEQRTFGASQPFQTPQVPFRPLAANSFFVHFLYGRFGDETVGFPRESKEKKEKF